MEENKQERLKNKIKALLSKTVANGATEAEALSALNKAQELMSQLRNDKDFINEIKLTNTKYSKVNIEKFDSFMKGLTHTLGQLFDCVTWYQPYNKTYVIFGETTDTEIYMYFYEYLKRMVIDLTEKYKDSPEFNTYHYLEGIPKKTITSSYRKGLVNGLAINVGKIYKDKISNFETQMMVINKRLVTENELSSLMPDLNIKKRNSTSRVHGDVYGTGKAIGRNTDISQPITGTRKLKQ